ncbi:MAG: thymidine kinase [Oscillospiraceae bacterium]|nr:thymidine kinase [Oscillospiraceae bacterium]
MAKLYFRYGAMNSGKSTALIQVAHNYEERGMHVILIKPSIDTKGSETVVSRIGVSRTVDLLVPPAMDLYSEIEAINKKTPLSCVLADEAQFFTPKQAEELFRVAVSLNVPVICYGLRSDFQMNGFPGSTRLLELAHSIEELKTICFCGKKAMINARLVNGEYVFEGEQVAIDGEASVEYRSVCPECYFRLKAEHDKKKKLNI